MPAIPSFTAVALAAALVAGPLASAARAQTDAAPAPKSDTGTMKPADPAVDLKASSQSGDQAADSAALAGKPSKQEASVPSLSGTLGIASVKLENGSRASKMIGASVYNEANEKVGTVDDLILKDDDKVAVAIISVGGFLGIGSKLVAVAYDQLHRDKDKVLLSGASKEALNSAPSFTYGT